MKILIGADPEVFVKCKESGKFVTGHNLIPGTKSAPFPVKNGAVQVDGMALEFNIDPAGSRAEFVNNISSVMSQLDSMVPNHDLVIRPTARFSSEYMSTMPKEALEMGCEPDYNAYSGLRNDKPSGDVNYRTAGGHIHIGWTEGVDVNDPDHIEACQMLVKALDKTIYRASPFFDNDNRRRALYGKKGSYRVKPYGVEYRVLSNSWLKSEELIGWVYDIVFKVTENLMFGKLREMKEFRRTLSWSYLSQFCYSYNCPFPLKSLSVAGRNAHARSHMYMPPEESGWAPILSNHDGRVGYVR